MGGTSRDPALHPSGEAHGAPDIAASNMLNPALRAGLSKMQSADFQIAAAVFVLCAVMTLLLYRSIVKSESKAIPLTAPLVAGVFDYNLVGASGCIGTLHSTFKDTPDSVIMNADGNVRVSFGGRMIPVKLLMEANFNALGQMGGSFLKIRADNVDLTFGSININPMTIRAKAIINGQQYVHDTTLPIAVDLKRDRNGTFIPYYSQQTGMSEGYMSVLSQPMLRDLRIGIEEKTAQAATCSGEASLDLTMALGRLMALASELSSTMKPILPSGS